MNSHAQIETLNLLSNVSKQLGSIEETKKLPLQVLRIYIIAILATTTIHSCSK